MTVVLSLTGSLLSFYLLTSVHVKPKHVREVLVQNQGLLPESWLDGFALLKELH